MYYNFIFITFICFSSLKLSGQNVVPNPSFEEFLCVPTDKDQANCLKDWFNPTQRTPDYNKRVNNLDNRYSNVPRNYWGFQEARTGDSYITLHTWTGADDPNEAENLQIKLKEPLKVGQEYQAKAFVVASSETTYSNGQSFLFTTEAFDKEKNPKQIYSNDFQLFHNTMVQDTLNWTEIGGTFIADKPYTHLTLGCFVNLSDARLKILHTYQWLPALRATYFWDDISVEPTNRKVDFTYTFLDSCFPIRIKTQSLTFSNASDWQWSLFPLIDIQNGESALFSISKNGDYTIGMNVRINNKEYTVSKVITVNFPEAPEANFDITTKKPKEKEQITFKNTSKNANQFLWDLGDSRVSKEIEPTHVYEEKGNYTIALTATNEKGCSNTISKIINIQCGKRIKANTFTPNGDGDNDVFPFDKFLPCDVKHIDIFNRWGAKVWETNDPSVSWGAENVSDGTYHYIVHFQDGNESGFIEVIR